MKYVICALAIAFAFPALAQNEPAVLTAEFSGQTADGKFLKIRQGQNRWVISELTPCKEYPCYPKNNTVERSVYPRFLTSRMMADGNTEVELDAHTKLVFVNNGMVPPGRDGKRAESYWQLEVQKADGSKESIRLRLIAFVLQADEIR